MTYRLVDRGSAWRLHRQWFDASLMPDLLDADFAVAKKNTLHRCLVVDVHLPPPTGENKSCHATRNPRPGTARCWPH